MFRPNHRYIPGVNERHSEETFELICRTARPNATIEELANCDAFNHGLTYLDEGYFWEAHEVFESVWMALPIESEERRFVQGLIQFANASLKAEMMRPNAVLRLCHMARELLGQTELGTVMNLNKGIFLSKLDELEKRILLSIKNDCLKR